MPVLSAPAEKTKQNAALHPKTQNSISKHIYCILGRNYGAKPPAVSEYKKYYISPDRPCQAKPVRERISGKSQRGRPERSVKPRSGPGSPARALCGITPRLFATRGFPPTRNTNTRALALLGLCSSLRSIRAAPLASALLLISPRPRRTAPASPVRSGRR